MKRETIVFESDDGEKKEFYVEEETRIGGTDYILVSDSDDDEANAFIFKDISGEGEDEARYVPVEDDTELDAVTGIFEQMLEDADIVR